MTAEELVGINKKERIRAEIDAMGLETLMDKDFVTVGPADTVNDVIHKMRDLDLHEVPVSGDGKRLMGVVSYGTLLRRKNLSIETKAESIMVVPQSIAPDAPVTAVAEFFLMSGFRQVPVQKDQNIEGIVSRSDLLDVVRKVRELGIIPVSEVMSPNVKTVSLDTSVSDAVSAMKSLEVRVLPVVDANERIIGVVGIKDIANYNWRERNRATVGELIGEKRPVEVKVGSVLVEPAVTASPSMDLNEAARVMLERNISSLPVVDGGKLVGIVTKYDLIELLASLRQRNVVYSQITGLKKDDRFSLDMMNKEIETTMRKISPIETPMLFNLHVGTYDEEGLNYKYSLHARLTTDDKIYTASSVDWDLIRATASLMGKLERRVIEHKEEKLDHRKRTRNIGHD